MSVDAFAAMINKAVKEEIKEFNVE
jgi:hypothetical protein